MKTIKLEDFELLDIDVGFCSVFQDKYKIKVFVDSNNLYVQTNCGTTIQISHDYAFLHNAMIEDVLKEEVRYNEESNSDVDALKAQDEHFKIVGDRLINKQVPLFKE